MLLVHHHLIILKQSSPFSGPYACLTHTSDYLYPPVFLPSSQITMLPSIPLYLHGTRGVNRKLAQKGSYKMLLF